MGFSRMYHPECFHCTTCSLPLGEKDTYCLLSTKEILWYVKICKHNVKLYYYIVIHVVVLEIVIVMSPCYKMDTLQLMCLYNKSE